MHTTLIMSLLLHYLVKYEYPKTYNIYKRREGFYGRKQLLLSARLSHRNSVRPSVRLSVTRMDQAKNGPS